MSAKGIVVVKPTGAIEVLGRRKLKEAKVFEAMLIELQTTVEKQKSAGHGFIDDLDVSQNHLSSVQLDSLFQTLAFCGVKVQRYRMFGIPTFDDDACHRLAEFIRSDLTSETVPSEMHLSDCAITTEGFMGFIDAIESSDLWPFSEKDKKIPLYLRLENNFIEDAILQEKIDAGLMRAYSKKGGSAWGRTATGDNHKIDLVVQQNTKSFQQKEGPPPAPEDAPAPKPVNDKSWGGSAAKGNGGSGGGKGGWCGGGKGGGKNAWSQGWEMWPAMQQQWQNPWAKGGVRPPAGHASAAGKGAYRPGAVVRPVGKVVAGGQASAQQVNAAQWMRGNKASPAQGGKGNAARPQQWNQKASSDRSRTPAGRTAAAPPARPPPAKKDLPHPWEEHYSEEHGINYFWNAETGEAVWERAQVK